VQVNIATEGQEHGHLRTVSRGAVVRAVAPGEFGKHQVGEEAPVVAQPLQPAGRILQAALVARIEPGRAERCDAGAEVARGRLAAVQFTGHRRPRATGAKDGPLPGCRAARRPELRGGRTQSRPPRIAFEIPWPYRGPAPRAEPASGVNPPLPARRSRPTPERLLGTPSGRARQTWPRAGWAGCSPRPGAAAPRPRAHIRAPYPAGRPHARGAARRASA